MGRNQHGPAQTRTTVREIVAFEVRRIYIGCGKCKVTFGVPHHLHSHSFKERDEIDHVAYLGDILYRHRAVGEQNRTDDLQSLVFGTLRCNFATKSVASFDYERTHSRL